MDSKSSRSSPSKSSLRLSAALIPLALSILLYLRWNNTIPSTALDISSVQETASSLYGGLSSKVVSTPESRHLALRDEYAKGCPAHRYTTRIFSMDPLIIYLENFIAPAETEYLIAKANGTYIRSRVGGADYDDPYHEGFLDSHRTSRTAYVDKDPIADCIRKRSAALQGSYPYKHIEDLQVVKYEVSHEFREHWDWWENAENPRVATIFAYLGCSGSNSSTPSADDGPCEGGSTRFTRYEYPFSSRWCDVVECESNLDQTGVAFKPILGNAIYWSNVWHDGSYHHGTYHAGMPVTKGRKIGLNIWIHRDHFPDFDELEQERLAEEAEAAKKIKAIKALKEGRDPVDAAAAAAGPQGSVEGTQGQAV